MPSRENIHIDTRLTNFSVGFAADNLTWPDEAFPSLPVQSQSDLYAVYGAEAFTLREDVIGPRETHWGEVDWEESTSAYFCRVHGLEHVVPDMQDPAYRAAEEQSAISLIMSVLLRNAVYDIAAYVTDAANVTNAGTATDFTVAGTDIRDYYLNECDEQALRTGIMPDSLIIGFDVMRAIIANDVVRDDIKYTFNPTTDPLLQLSNDMPRVRKLIADYLGLQRVIVPMSIYNNDNEASTTLARMWPTETSLLYYRGPATGTDAAGRSLTVRGMPTFVNRFFWNGFPRAQAGIAAYKVNDQLVGTGGTRVRAFMAYDRRVTWDDAGTLGTGMLS